MPRSYGESAGEITGAGKSQIVYARSLKRGVITATQLDLVSPSSDPSATNDPEEAFVIATWQSSVFKREIWVDGRSISAPDQVQDRSFTIMDLRQRYSALWKVPFNILLFTLPRPALAEIAEEAGSRPFDEFDLRPGTPYQDGVVSALADALKPTMQNPEQVSTLFVDHVTRAVAMHAMETYGGLKPEKLARGGLAPWQTKRLLELLDANLDGDLSLADMAKECGLSTRHLGRAFKESTGMPPYRWVLQRRLERAKGLLRDGVLSIGEIAAASGFADQAHFTRTFTRCFGISPAVWRRHNV